MRHLPHLILASLGAYLSVHALPQPQLQHQHILAPPSPHLLETSAQDQQRLGQPLDGGRRVHRPENQLRTSGNLVRFSFRDATISGIMEVVDEYKLDVWQLTSTYVDIYLPQNPDNSRPVPTIPRYLKQRCDVTRNTDISASIPPPPRDVNEPNWDLYSLQNSTFHEGYHRLYEIDGFIQDLAGTYPEQISLVSLGHSSEGREMFAIKVSNTKNSLTDDDDEFEADDEDDVVDSGKKKKNKKKKSKKVKPAFVLTGAQHAREWVATASALYMAHALVAHPKEKNSMSRLLKHFDFHIIPAPNPDGYVYTWESDRFWYKNRMIAGPDEECIGLDMNRNWGYHWSADAPTAGGLLEAQASTPDTNLTKKSHADPCSVWYPGHRPFEAPEVNNIANYISQTKDVLAFIDLRSYGQMLSWPFSHSCDAVPRDAEDVIEAAYGVAHVLRKKFANVYAIGSLCSMLYSAPGNILDWMYGGANIKYAYAAHLQDTGTYGYTLPPDLIRPAGEETATMVEYLVDFIVNYEEIH